MRIKLEKLLSHTFKEITCDTEYDIQHVTAEFRLRSDYFEGFDATLFKIKEIYNNPHDSDESSYRRLLYFKNKFCCVFGYTGDRGYTFVEFANREIANELRQYMESLLPEEYNINIIKDDEVELSDQYTTFVQDDEDGNLYYIIKNPAWGGNFDANDTNMYYAEDAVADDDKYTLIKCNFVKFKFDLRKTASWELKEDDKRIFVELTEGDKKGQIIEAEFYRVLFRV